MVIVAKGNPLSQAFIGRDAQECVFLNKLHTACLSYPFIHLGEETKWSNISKETNMTARLKSRHTLYSKERKLASLPSDPVLDFSPLFPSFFLLFPDDNELADLLFAFSFKEMFRLTGCEVDPGAAPSCSNSRSTKTT